MEYYSKLGRNQWDLEEQKRMPDFNSGSAELDAGRLRFHGEPGGVSFQPGGGASAGGPMLTTIGVQSSQPSSGCQKSR